MHTNDLVIKFAQVQVGQTFTYGGSRFRKTDPIVETVGVDKVPVTNNAIMVTHVARYPFADMDDAYTARYHFVDMDDVYAAPGKQLGKWANTTYWLHEQVGPDFVELGLEQDGQVVHLNAAEIAIVVAYAQEAGIKVSPPVLQSVKTRCRRAGMEVQ